MTIYERLVELAKIKGTNITAVAKELKISTSLPTSWKSGIYPSAENIIKLSDYFKVSCDYILRGEEKYFKSQYNNSPVIERSRNVSIDYGNNNNFGDGSIQDNSKHYDFSVADNPPTGKKFNFQKNLKGYGFIDFSVNNQCPICHHEILPHWIRSENPSADISDLNKGEIVNFYFCPNCRRVYAVLHKVECNVETNTFPLVAVDAEYTPYEPNIAPVPDEFKNDNFARFQGTYKDLELVKAYQINGLLGLAYRKMLECLIREILIFTEKSKDIANFKDVKLYDLIRLFTDNNDIITLADEIRIIGNDSAHYYDKTTPEEIESLDSLSELIISQAEMVVKAKRLREKRKK